MSDKKKAVVLLSGGLDSATALGIAKSDGFEIFAISFRYGQRHAVELDCAKRIAAHQNISQHVIADIDLRVFGGSALTADIDVPKIVMRTTCRTASQSLMSLRETQSFCRSRWLGRKC